MNDMIYDRIGRDGYSYFLAFRHMWLRSSYDQKTGTSIRGGGKEEEGKKKKKKKKACTNNRLNHQVLP